MAFQGPGMPEAANAASGVPSADPRSAIGISGGNYSVMPVGDLAPLPAPAYASPVASVDSASCETECSSFVRDSLQPALLFIRDRRTGWSFLIDTGAERSIVPPSKKERTWRSDFKLFMADGSPLTTYGFKQMSINIGFGRNMKWLFVVANVTDPILGAEFLRNFDLVVDVKRKLLTDRSTGLVVKCSPTPQAERKGRRKRRGGKLAREMTSAGIGWRRYREIRERGLSLEQWRLQQKTASGEKAESPVNSPSATVPPAAQPPPPPIFPAPPSFTQWTAVGWPGLPLQGQAGAELAAWMASVAGWVTSSVVQDIIRAYSSGPPNGQPPAQ